MSHNVPPEELRDKALNVPVSAQEKQLVVDAARADEVKPSQFARKAVIVAARKRLGVKK